MDYTKGEQILRDKIRDKCAYNGASVMSATYADAIMEIPEVRASPDMYEALKMAQKGKGDWRGMVDLALAKAEGK